MAILRPFRGLRYNLTRTGDLSRVITQPYDRIHAAEQSAYYSLHPWNFVRIDMGLSQPDEPGDNVYTRAACYARTWLAEGILMREPAPALYVVEQVFAAAGGRTVTRRGVTGALQLARFDEGIILPHERTLSGPKADRLNLTRATRTAWGHILALYPDAENQVNALIQPHLDAHAPVVAREQVIEPAVEQRFWVLDDPGLIAGVAALMAPKRHLIIADGHHRYETALNYRDESRPAAGDGAAPAAWNHALVTLVSMSDPGLVILPTHRLVHSYARMTGAQLLAAVAPFFEVARLDGDAALQSALAGAQPERPRFGFYDGGHAVLTLRSPDAMAALAADRAPAWRSLDVSVLHRIILETALGLSPDSIARQENIRYLRDAAPGRAAVDRGEADFLFILNPTRMDQVRACAEAGEIMPQKSTDFYPKILSGWVSLPLSGALDG